MMFEAVGTAVYDAASDELRPVAREVLHRTMYGGGEVAIYWHSITGAIELRVTELGSDVVQTATIAPEAAADALQHPYCYLPSC